MVSRRLTAAMVADMERVLLDSRHTHIVLRGVGGAYPRVRVAGRYVPLARHLYAAVTGETLDRATVLRDPGACGTPDCYNPFHMVQTRRSKGAPKTCRNGHKKLRPGPCQPCRAMRNARRRQGRWGKGYCRNGHPLSRTNTYRWTDKDGKTHRRCRRCQLDRQRAYRERSR